MIALHRFAAFCAVAVAALTGVALAQPAAAPAMPAVLRVGVINGAAGSCTQAPRDQTPYALYAAHLAARLNLRIDLCPLADDAAAAAAFANGAVDFAPLTPGHFAAAANSARPILRLRAKSGLARTPVAAVAKTSLTISGASAVASRRIGVLAAGPFLHDAPRAALAAAGGSAVLNTETRAVGIGAPALAALQSGVIDILLLPAAYWSVACGEAGDSCAAFHVVWQGMPPVERAWALRNDLPRELRYRLIGIHVPMHLENPSLFAAIAGADAAEFEPTEAGALNLAAVR